MDMINYLLDKITGRQVTNTVRNHAGDSIVGTQKKRPTNPIYLEELPENTMYQISKKEIATMNSTI